MKVFESVKELRAELDKAEQSGIGFVPTMGALHAGHRSLVERARRENDTVVVSVFVNPTQFNDKNDLKHYPRTPEADARLLEEAGADFVLMPTVEEIYPQPDTRQFDFGLIDKVMEGATRPGHFIVHYCIQNIPYYIRFKNNFSITISNECSPYDLTKRLKD